MCWVCFKMSNYCFLVWKNLTIAHSQSESLKPSYKSKSVAQADLHLLHNIYCGIAVAKIALIHVIARTNVFILGLLNTVFTKYGLIITLSDFYLIFSLNQICSHTTQCCFCGAFCQPGSIAFDINVNDSN